MPQFIPLQFYQYNWSDNRIDPEKVISPPYDVMSEQDKTNLAETEYNVVHLDSPVSYEAAAGKLDAWFADEILVQDSSPGFYIMATDYQAGNDKKTRWGIFGGLRLHPFEDKKVFPHEQTYSKAKTDRLNLMQATHGQLSPIFGIYNDPGLILEEIGRKCLENRPLISFTQENGVFNRIWRVPAEYHQTVENLIQDKKVFIADGHHRYETALNYQNMKPRHEKAPWNHVFMYLSNIASPGLEIFPYHRIISHKADFDWDEILNRAEQDFEISVSQKFPDIHAEPRSDSFILYCSKGFVSMKPRNMPEDIFYHIGAYVLDRLFLRQAMKLSERELASVEFLSYSHDQSTVINRVDQGTAQAGFILKPVPMDVLGQVCETGQVMPRKSTFFYPKLPTGALFHLWRDKFD